MPAFNIVPFVSVENMMRLVHAVGIEALLTRLAAAIAEDFAQWHAFHKTPRIAAHSPDGVIELMPTSDGTTYGFKYVNGHPSNTVGGRQTVTAFGVLADVGNGYPVLITEMTLLTALRTAATSALAARHLARPNSRTMAVIGNGAQAEFQALAFRALLGVDALRLYDIDPAATRKCLRNLAGLGFDLTACTNTAEALRGADIVTTVTADKRNAVILGDNLVGEGVHVNAVGGDCPGKTELAPEVLRRADLFVEYEPQTRIEGEIQQLAPDHPVTELWRVLAGDALGRTDPRQITVFDSVGFAIEDFSALRTVRDLLAEYPYYEDLDLLADPDDPRDLFGMLQRARPPRPAA
ncbi:ornithine cyclodeaminase [Methylobacterium gregans]|uniref:Ornithine cyclodeaminase n=1 Tax=Methylobacterium gregans TaxID=374424 RepID=A0AA37MBL0_9HYPH|nr:ornithine cyclodeaminase [Methylobacterium gregans]MDQ0519504.1 ornithine cyclodeaminase [Methylobacterium gregans]GJD79278.1 Ornithine cyclodeaminase [Methylobacterium gregans]GLS52855.1 ornithine cyclodeaminase [Methylobacterium gregans]